MEGDKSLEKILEQLNIGTILDFQRITGGRDSVVYKVRNMSEKRYAVRILPHERVDQFKQEEHLINIAHKNGIPVPFVHQVMEVEKYAVMVMEWGRGRTVLQELLDNPKNATELGMDFGRMQRQLHDVMPSEMGKSEWLAPKSEREKKLYEKARSANETKICFLHMDYHPLNVLAENSEITGVLDWMNASSGDYRYDLARTYSILSVEEAKQYLGIDDALVKRFREAWLDGYYSISKGREELDLYIHWANDRLVREMTVD